MAAHKMQDGRWCVWLDLGSDPLTGKRLRKRVEARTKREAEMKATALRERHGRGEDVNKRPRTLSELLDEWLMTIEQIGKAPNTLAAYRNASNNHLKRYLGTVSVPRLQPRDIQAVFNDLATRLAPSNIRLIKTVLVQALNLAIEQHEITVNPAEKVRTPIVRRDQGRSLVPSEVRALRAASEGRRYGLAVHLALLGLRRAELPGLRWEDFDEQAGTLIICRQIQRIGGRWVPVAPKAGSVRMIALGPRLTAALRQLRWQQADERDAMGWPNSGYIFVSSRTGDVCPPRTIHDAWRSIAKAAGIGPARLHDCRHTAATELLAAGEDIATVAGVLGHASPHVTATIYAHKIPHKIASAARRLEDIYSDDDAAVPAPRNRADGSSGNVLG